MNSGPARIPPGKRLLAPGRGIALCAALALAAFSGAPSQGTQFGQCAQDSPGAIAASTPGAAQAGAEILSAGGNAIDAAVAAAFALTVTDPAMTSLAGRTQILAHLQGGRIVGLDGATQQPPGVPPLAEKEDRAAYQTVPIPGNPATLLHLHRLHGRLPRARVLAPAIRLAEVGFPVSPRVAEIWEEERPRFEKDLGARKHYLKPDGSAYRAGETYRNPAIARLLRALARDGRDAFYRGDTGKTVAADVTGQGGFVKAPDLVNYRPGDGAVVRTRYRDWEVLTLGRHAWGNTLAEMLNILSHFELQRGSPTPRELELVARTIAQALQDRPQALGTLAPKKDGLSLDLISSLEFARERAERVRKALGEPAPSAPQAPLSPPQGEDHDTTHLSVMDAEGNAVALTTSIGPRFGARVASPELGFFYAHSYRMRSSPEPGARDHTEMTPTIVLRDGRPVLVIGAAGSERIPGAILQVLSHLLDRGLPLEEALRAPRVFSADANRIRLWDDTPAAVRQALRQRGFDLELVTRDPRRHLGIVHAVARDPATGVLTGAADPVYDGAALNAPPGKARSGQNQEP